MKYYDSLICSNLLSLEGRGVIAAPSLIPVNEQLLNCTITHRENCLYKQQLLRSGIMQLFEIMCNI